MALTRGGLAARLVGFLVFLAGVGVIVYVLVLALAMFRDPNLGVQTAVPGVGPSATTIGVGFGQIIVRILLLFLASLCGSLIANKGIQLWLHDSHPAPVKMEGKGEGVKG